jgi:hypothetical protein
MASTVFICSVKWRDEAKEEGRTYFGGTWLPRQQEACERYGITLLRWGLPFGVAEDHTFIYEGDISVADFMEFKAEISWVDGERLWDYSKTTILHCPD